MLRLTTRRKTNMSVQLEDLQNQKSNSIFLKNPPTLDGIQIQPQFEKFSCEFEGHKKLRKSKNVISCSEAERCSKLSPEGISKASESVLIYKLYDSSRQRKVNGVKNQTSNNQYHNKKIKKQDLRQQSSNQLLRHSAIFDGDRKQNNSSKTWNWDQGFLTGESHRFSTATLGQRSVLKTLSEKNFVASKTAGHVQVSRTSRTDSIEACNVAAQDCKTKEATSQDKKVMIDTQLLQFSDADVTSAVETTTCSQTHQLKRRSKVIEVDGVYYILTMGKSYI